MENQCNEYNQANKQNIIALVAQNDLCVDIYDNISLDMVHLNEELREISLDLRHSTGVKGNLVDMLRIIKIFDFLKKKDEFNFSKLNTADIKKICQNLQTDLSTFSSDISFLVNTDTIFIDGSLQHYRETIVKIGDLCIEVLESNFRIALSLSIIGNFCLAIMLSNNL